MNKYDIANWETTSQLAKKTGHTHEAVTDFLMALSDVISSDLLTKGKCFIPFVGILDKINDNYLPEANKSPVGKIFFKPNNRISRKTNEQKANK